MTLAQIREWGLQGLKWGLGILVVGDILYLMIKAQLYSPLQDQKETPAPAAQSWQPSESANARDANAQESEAAQVSPMNATVGWFNALTVALAMWLWRDKMDWMDVWVGLPFLVGTVMWGARRSLTWPLAGLWLTGGGALVYGVYMAANRLPDIDRAWVARSMAMLALAGMLYFASKEGPLPLRTWLYLLVPAFVFWVVGLTEAVFFIAAFAALTPVVQWMRREWQANH
jgi:hypothetical protein